MSQNRDAPAYQEYAATILSNLTFRMLPLTARGLLWTIRLELWVNRRLPADPESLARIFGVPESQINPELQSIMAFLKIVDGHLTSPELDDYRQHLDDRKSRQRAGGKAGAAMTNGGKKEPKGKQLPKDGGNPTGEPPS